MNRIIDISDQLYATCIRLNNVGDARPSAVCIANSLPYEERSKGKWKLISMGLTYKYQCSLCGRTISTTPMFLAEYPFCHCGADMRKGGAE